MKTTRRGGAAALAILLILIALPGSAEDPFAREEIVRIPLTVPTPLGTERLRLEGTLFRPDGEGPFPLAVINHGSPRDPAFRRSGGRARFVEQSAWFVARGFAVIVPMRRGYAGSEGEWAEGGGGPCERSNWYLAGRESARDIRAAVEFMQGRPFIDPGRLVLVGQSAGGFGVLALAAEGVDGLRGVVNFAGGRGSPLAGKNCSPSNLVYAMGEFGRTAKAPTLWIYTENDSFFPVPMVRDMHAAFLKGGAIADLRMLPRFGTDGHALFVRGTTLWSPLVEVFLERAGVLQPPK